MVESLSSNNVPTDTQRVGGVRGLIYDAAGALSTLATAVGNKAESTTITKFVDKQGLSEDYAVTGKLIKEFCEKNKHKINMYVS